MLLSNKSYKRRIKKKIKPLRGTLETRLVVRKGGLLEVSGGKGWRRQRRAGCRVLQESTRTGGTLWRAGSSSASWRQADTPLITIYSTDWECSDTSLQYLTVLSHLFSDFLFLSILTWIRAEQPISSLLSSETSCCAAHTHLQLTLED